MTNDGPVRGGRAGEPAAIVGHERRAESPARPRPGLEPHHRGGRREFRLPTVREMDPPHRRPQPDAALW